MPADDELRRDDAAARRAALDVRRSFIVQAPAGSGKTELLIQRYLGLLATVEEPEEVVAITFTRKAANEMQLRVVAALDGARRQRQAAADHERRTLRAAAAVLARDRQRGWQLGDAPQRLRIQTLDAFCAALTRLLPVSSGFGGGLETVADAPMQRLYRDAAAATLDWLPDRRRRAPLERVLEHLDGNVDAYLDQVANMLAKRDQWLDLVGGGGRDDAARTAAVRRELEANIEARVRARLQNVRRRLAAAGGAAERRLLRRAAGKLAGAGGDPHPLAALGEADWPPADASGLGTWRALADFLLTKNGSLRRRVDKRHGFAAGDGAAKAAFTTWLGRLAAAPGLEQELQRVRRLPDVRYRDEQWAVLLALFELLPLAVAELRRLFAERGVTDHAEVALAALAALGSAEQPGELALRLDYRIRHLLVDEMQDTSVGQYRLLAQLTAGWERGDGRTLFCVGDPMQSIYRFRDADVGRFLAARRHGIGDVALEPLLLRRNFRSGENLVAWCNRAFAQLLPDVDDPASGAIAHAASTPVPQHAGQGRLGVHPLIDASTEEEGGCTAGVVAGCLARDEDGSVAVLVRSRTQLPQLLAVLRERGIAYRAIEIDRLTDLPEIIDLLALTRALCHDGDRLAWLALLRGPWAGLGWADLHALVQNERRASVRELSRDEARLARLSEGGRARLEAFFTTLEDWLGGHAVRGLRDRVECTWLALDGPALLGSDEQLDNACRFLDVVESLEHAGSLRDIARLERRLDGERVSSPGDEHTRVQVMTMHKAKGLEFDHVVLHALGRVAAGDERDVLNWLSGSSDEGDSRLVISPVGPRAELDKDPLYAFIAQAARDSDRLELDRLLYVACTRAVRSLHLVGSVPTRKDGTEPGRPARQSLLHRLWPLLEQDFAAAFGKRRPAAGRDGDDTVLRAPRVHRRQDGWRAPPLPPPPPVAQAARAGPPAEEVEFHWAGSAARHAGTVVHRWLQVFAASRPLPARPPPAAAAVSRRWAAALGVAPGELDQVVARVQAALERALADPSGRWLLSGHGHAELRLTGMHQGVAATVAIDRVRIDGARHWLVDYKTGTHEGGDRAGFLAQERARYRPQLERYRAIYRAVYDVPVRIALYFPLLGALVDLDEV